MTVRTYPRKKPGGAIEKTTEIKNMAGEWQLGKKVLKKK